MAVSKNVDAWKEKITTMNFADLTDVEYQPVGIGTKWKYMFETITGDNKETLRCVLCETNRIGNWTSIKQHIEGKRHLGKFRVAVRDVRHRTIKLGPGGVQAQKPKAPAQAQAKPVNVQAKPANAQAKPPVAAAKPAQPIKPVAAAGNAQTPAKTVANTTQQPSKVTPQNTPKRQETPSPAPKQSPLPKETAKQNIKDTTDSQKGSETGAGASQVGKKVINPCSLLAKSNDAAKPAYASLQDFRNNLAKLDLSDLLLVEFRYVNTDFVPIFEQSNNTYTCKMCRNGGISNLQAIRSHMSNKQHQTNISLVKTLHHPLLYPTKENDVKPAKATESARMPPPATPAPQRVPPSSTPGPQRVPPSPSPLPQRVPPSPSPLPQRVPPSSTPLPQRVPPSSTPLPQRVPPSSTPAPQAAKPSTPVQSKPTPAKPSPSTTSAQKQTPPAPAISAKVDLSKQNVSAGASKMEVDDMYDGKNLIPLMKTLDVPELLKIEYRFSAQTAEWKHMFRQVHENAFKCLLCSTFLIKNVHDLRQHIGSIRHQSAIKTCKQLHHPDLAPVKPSSTATPITEQRKIMNDKQFRDHVLKLTVSELCEIEYLMKSSWYKLASCTPSQNHYSCYLCDLINATGTINNMRVHLQSKRHMERMESVQMLFHPFYTASKQELQEQVKDLDKGTETVVERPQKVVCTIELEDSPEREIPRSNEKSKTVLNPAALAISNEKEGTAIKTIMNVGRSTSFGEHNQQKQNTSFGSQNNQLNSSMGPGGNPYYQMRDNQNQSWQSDPMRSQGNNFNKSMSMGGYPSQGNNFGQSQMHRNQFDQTLLMGSSQGNNFGQSQQMGSQMSMGPPGNNNNFGQSRNIGSQHIHSVQTLPNLMDSNNFRSMQQNNSVERFQPANSNLRKQYGPNAQQGDRIIIPRVQQKDENPNNNNPVSFASKDIINDTIQPIEGLIGVEYVVKILRNANDPAPRYECSLCEVEVDGTSMQWHLKGLHHRTKYLDRHFPTVMKQFQQYSNRPEMSYLMSQITDKLAIAIEEYHGRDLPFECLIDEFRLNHDGIKSKVFSFRHPSELTGPSFTNVVDKNELDKFIARKSFRMPEPDKKRKPTFDINENMQPKRLRDLSPLKNSNLDNINRNQSQSMQDNADRNRRYDRNSSGRRQQSRSRSRERGRSPPGDSRRYQQYNNRDDWSTYMRMFDHSLVDLKKDYEEYKRDPECHPAYNSEWKKFWTRRTDELRTEGRNPSSYNFQPEWVKFFSRRVHELYEEAVEDLRLSLRKRLNLPMRTNNPLLDELYHVGVDRIARIPYDIDMDMDRHPSQMNQVQQQPRQQQYNQSQQQRDQGRFDDMQQQHQQQRQGQFNSAQQQMNQRRSIDDYNNEDQYRRQGGGGDSQNIENQAIGNVAEQDEEEPVDEEDGRDDDDDIIEIVDIKTEVIDNDYDDSKNMSVAVLRLLTALEDHLGILGPRVIDLLSKALTLEKIKPNGVDEALLNHENYVFLETVREKLKGQLLAGVIEGPKERAVKKVINDMNKMFDKYKPSIPTAMPVSTAPTATKDPPVPPKMTPAKKPAAPAVVLNKEELATKLASALAAQGKTDVTAEQLEQLVAVYALIERKQHENALAGKPNQSNQKKSLSDTLIDFLKPNSNADSTPPLSVQKQQERNNNYGRTNQASYSTSTPYANQSFRSRSPQRLMEIDSYPSQRMNQSQQNMGQQQTQRMDQGGYSNMGGGGGNYSNMGGGSSYPHSNVQRPTSSFSFINTPFSSLSQFDTSLKLNTQMNDKWGSFTSNRSSNAPTMISYPDLRRNNPNNNNSLVGSSNRASGSWENQGSQQSRSDNFGIWQQGNNASRRF